MLLALDTTNHFDWIIFNDGVCDPEFDSIFCAARELPNAKVAVIIHHTANNWMYGTCNSKELAMMPLLTQVDAMIYVDKIWALWWHHLGVRSLYIPISVSIEHHGAIRQVRLVRSVDETASALVGRRKIVWIGRLGDSLNVLKCMTENLA